MSEKLQEATIKALQGKLTEAKNSHEAANDQIIKYHIEEYNVPDDTPEEVWNDFVKDIKKDYKLDATKENGEVYVRGTRANIISFMMNELEIADINILNQSQDDSDIAINKEAIEDASYIIENLKKKLIHSSNYNFEICFGGERIDIIHENNKDASTYEFIIIEDNYYKLYASWKFDRSGYGYMGFTFKSQDINEFIDKTIIKLDKKFYEYETEPYKSDSHLIEIVAFLKKWHNWKFYKSAIPFFYYAVSKEELASYIEKAKKDAPQEFDKLVKQYNINFEKDYKFIKKYLNLNNS